MASQSSNLKRLRNGRELVMNSVKSVHNQVLETTETLIDETVNSGVKYQKLATKAIKKTEPLLDKQVDIIFDTVETVYEQVQKGNKRFQKLLGITKTVNKAKTKASKTFKAATESFEKNFEMASKTIKTVADRVEDNIEKLSSNIKVSTEKAEQTTKTAAKNVRKRTTAGAKTAKKTVRKTVSRARKATTTKKK